MSDSVQFNSQVGDDGVLNVQIDLGRAEAKKEVVVTIQPVAKDKSTGKDLYWSEFIQQTYGSCHDLGLERHNQGEFEQREPVS